MDRPRAWLMTAMGSGQQYAGNRGYADDPRRVYRFDNHVANSRNVAERDIALVRDGEQLLGVGLIRRLRWSPGYKTLRRCPRCRTVDLKTRRKKRPLYRCGKGHEFARPVVERVRVTLFEALFGNSFVRVHQAVPAREIKAAAFRPSDQLSIEEIDMVRLERLLWGRYPLAHAPLARFFQQQVLSDEDADETEPAADGQTGGSDPYRVSLADSRRKVLRSIRERRGQRRFRNSLLRRYGRKCVASGCTVTALLEAAHIRPYRGEPDNHPENGLLLRADLHTLFDLHLLRIEPLALTLHFDPRVREDGYAHLDGRRLLVHGRGPSREALATRWEQAPQFAGQSRHRG